MSRSLTEELAEEIRALHGALEAWYRGALEGEEALDREVMSRLDPAFLRLSAEGRRMDRAALERALLMVGGANPSFRLTVRRVRLLASEGGLAVACFDELQHEDDQQADPEDGMLCSATLRRDARAPGGWRWLVLHETWLG